MTDLVVLPSSSVARRPGRPALLLGIVAVAAFAGAAVGRLEAADPVAFEPSLALLLRFMALCKGAGALAATALVLWRLKRPLAGRCFSSYAAALALMAAAAGLIWNLGLVAFGALLFHAGLVLFLVTAVRDDEVADAVARRRRA